MNFKTLKKEARQAMKAAKPSPVLVCLIVLILMVVVQGLNLYIDGSYDTAMTIMTAEDVEDAINALYSDPESVSLVGQILAFALELMFMVLSVGFVLYCMRICRGEKAGLGDVFDAFGVFFRCIWVSFLPSLVISAWAMPYSLALSYAALTGKVWLMYAASPLLILPIRAWYSYRFAVYLTLDNPHLRVIQCMAMSRAVLKGHLWELFRLDMSFIGWYVLSIIPFVALWVCPYAYVTHVGYYRAVLSQFREKHPELFPPEPAEPAGQETDQTGE